MVCMGASGASDADRDLAAQASRLGTPVSPRQIKRWREDGRLEGPMRRGRGQGLGSVAFYRPGVEQHAAYLAAAVDLLGGLDFATLGAFARGFAVKERALRGAYRYGYGKVREALGAGVESDPWRVADRFSKGFSRRSSTMPTARAWRDRLRALRKGGQLGPAVHDLVRFALGGAEEYEFPSPEVFEALGLDGVVESLAEEDRYRLHEFLHAFNLPAFERTVAAANMEKLEGARDQVSAMLGFFLPSRAPVDPAESDLILALVGVPGTIIMGSFVGGALAAGIARMQEAASDQGVQDEEQS